VNRRHGAAERSRQRPATLSKLIFRRPLSIDGSHSI
jgi:hypothetical protein